MIEYIKHRVALSKLFKTRDKLNASFREKIEKADRLSNPEESIGSIQAEASFELGMIDDEIAIMVTNYLTRQANRKFVPIPSHTDNIMWTQCSILRYQDILTSQGINLLRTSLRAEIKDRNEMWITILAALTGVIGALTGFVAIINN